MSRVAVIAPKGLSEFLSPSRLAERLGVSQPTVHGWLNRGLPCIRRNKSPRINFEVAERWLREQPQTEALDSDAANPENEIAALEVAR